MAETRFLNPQKHISQKVRRGGPSMEQAILLTKDQYPGCLVISTILIT